MPSGPMVTSRCTRPAPAGRIRLDVDSWFVLRQGLLAQRPGVDVPQQLRPAAFDLPTNHWLDGERRDRAWLQLVQAHLATDIPDGDELTTVHPDLVAAMEILAHPALHAVVQSWQPGAARTQLLAWDSGQAVAVTRSTTAGLAWLPASPVQPGTGYAGRVSTVEVAFLAGSALVNEICRALPAGRTTTHLDGVDAARGMGATRGTGMTRGIGAARGVGAGRWDGAAHAGPARRDGHRQAGLHLLGRGAPREAAVPSDGGARVAIHRALPAAEGSRRRAGYISVFTGRWVWTGTDVAAVVQGREGTLALQPTQEHQVRRRLATAVTAALADSTVSAA